MNDVNNMDTSMLVANSKYQELLEIAKFLYFIAGSYKGWYI